MRKGKRFLPQRTQSDKVQSTECSVKPKDKDKGESGDGLALRAAVDHLRNMRQILQILQLQMTFLRKIGNWGT